MYFYVSGRAGKPGTNEPGICSTGLAVLRRDGFASLDADTTEGMLTTRTLRFPGKYLFVNVDAEAGELRAEVFDENGQVIPPFTKDDCIPVKANKTLQAVTWKSGNDLTAVANRKVKFRFYLTNGSLYSFWVSSNQSGASNGYVAAGGPGYVGSADTVGASALQ